jgi:hypothetical protein
MIITIVTTDRHEEYYNLRVRINDQDGRYIASMCSGAAYVLDKIFKRKVEQLKVVFKNPKKRGWKSIRFARKDGDLYYGKHTLTPSIQRLINSQENIYVKPV